MDLYDLPEKKRKILNAFSDLVKAEVEFHNAKCDNKDQEITMEQVIERLKSDYL